MYKSQRQAKKGFNLEALQARGTMQPVLANQMVRLEKRIERFGVFPKGEHAMLSKLLCAVGVLAISVPMVTGEEFTAKITKVEGEKVTFIRLYLGLKMKTETSTLPVAKGVKFAEGIVDLKDRKTYVGDDLKDGLQNEAFQGANDKNPLAVQITTTDDKMAINRILVTRFGAKKSPEKK